jgi:hypothetical protein
MSLGARTVKNLGNALRVTCVFWIITSNASGQINFIFGHLDPNAGVAPGEFTVRPEGIRWNEKPGGHNQKKGHGELHTYSWTCAELSGAIDVKSGWTSLGRIEITSKRPGVEFIATLGNAAGALERTIGIYCGTLGQGSKNVTSAELDSLKRPSYDATLIGWGGTKADRGVLYATPAGIEFVAAPQNYSSPSLSIDCSGFISGSKLDKDRIPEGLQIQFAGKNYKFHFGVPGRLVQQAVLQTCSAGVCHECK